ncbi:MAG: valine--tRNA ligase, partial [Cytophagaceae bacterium]
DQQVLTDFETLFEIVSNIRNVRNTKQLSPRIELPLAIRTTDSQRFQVLEPLIQKMANVSAISYTNEKADGTAFLIKADEFFVNLAGEVDAEQEIASAQKELEYLTGFRESTQKKLSNEKFVANAKPELVERERQKLADADAKIQALTERLTSLSAG